MKVTISKKEWMNIGKKSGWVREAKRGILRTVFDWIKTNNIVIKSPEYTQMLENKIPVNGHMVMIALADYCKTNNVVMVNEEITKNLIYKADFAEKYDIIPPSTYEEYGILRTIPESSGDVADSLVDYESGLF